MPFIDVKTNVTFSKEKADELMKELSGSLKAIGKSEAYVMCAVNYGLKMSFQGSSDEPAAIVEVKLLGKGTKRRLCQSYREYLQYYADKRHCGQRCYVKYDEVEHWGMDSFMF